MMMVLEMSMRKVVLVVFQHHILRVMIGMLMEVLKIMKETLVMIALVIHEKDGW